MSDKRASLSLHRTRWAAVLALLAALPLAACMQLQARVPEWVAPRVDGDPVTRQALAASAAAATRLPPGLNASGEVLDPARVERGSGSPVTGVDGWRGEVVGTAPEGSRLAPLQVGMTLPQVVALVGTPSDQGAYTRGRPWLPAMLGTGVYRHELLYRGEGRLVFAGGAPGDYAQARLVWIIHSAAETGVR